MLQNHFRVTFQSQILPYNEHPEWPIKMTIFHSSGVHVGASRNIIHQAPWRQSNRDFVLRSRKSLSCKDWALNILFIMISLEFTFKYLASLIHHPLCARHWVDEFVGIVFALGYGFLIVPSPRNIQPAEAQRGEPSPMHSPFLESQRPCSPVLPQPCCLIISSALLCGRVWSCGMCWHWKT